MPKYMEKYDMQILQNMRHMPQSHDCYKLSCPVLRPYQLGPMRIPNVTIGYLNLLGPVSRSFS